ncbi:hypothetical protein KXV27_005019 [Aspergillus fumigatus]|nr:hypothetical protein CNMCM8714_005205 [Aspergillus fumigatus]KAH1308302.1 hypothetical protein KXX11_005790 [Aspergillus fumigatus]KAH1517174.1 hypothetical protein KXX29_008526 [Aspergillus fumigatus]KAH1532647.1 hypothetical protein KXX18_005605 [Aspergillus fumigatus]KAH1578114.1 hypothetical protein KXX17_006860 [Aspergillus fumigatus]
MPVHSNAATRESKHANSEASQITINTEARDVLRDLFPNIPDNDLNQIIKTAFQKGQRKVGTAVELPLARRAQLAVVAHIRHIYTDYDRLLKTTSFHEARSAVEEPTLAKLVEWRGDDENGKTVLEDVFREVIVISDDDDSDAEEGEVSRSINRDHSIEIVSSHQRADELQMRPVNFSHPTVQDSHLDISDDEPPPGFRFIPESPKKRRLDRRGFSRYHAWDRALNRYRKGTYHQHRFYADSTGHPGPLLTARQPVQENITFDPGATCHPHITALRHVSVDPHIASKTEVLHHGQRRTLTRTLKENHKSWLINGIILTLKANQQPGGISRSTSWSNTGCCILFKDLLGRFTFHQMPAMLLPLQMRAAMLSPSCLTPLQKLDVFMKVVESTKKLEKRLICQICRVWGIIIIIIIIIAPSILMGHPGEAYMPMTSYALLIIGMIYDWLANASTVMCKQLDLWILFPDQLMTTFDTIQAGNFLIRRIVHSSIHHIQLQIIEARESVDALMIKPLRIIIALVTTVDMKHTVLLLHLTGMPELMNDKCNI